MDALSDVLRVVGLTGAVFMDAEFTEPWSVTGQVAPELCRPFMAQPAHVVSFHYVVEGGFDLSIDGKVICAVSAGEAVLLPHNDLHVFASPGHQPPVAMGDLIKRMGGPGLVRIERGGGGARSRLVCGFMGGNAQIHPLLSGLPAVMKMDVATMPGGDWIGRTFTYATQSVGEGDPGAAAVLAKISELLFVESVRRYLAELPLEETGWLAGLRDPAVGKALAALHARVGEPWTSEGLASEVNMSRSAFAERFSALIGQPPMSYLTGWRMQLARHSLLESRRTVAQIAYEVGYESEAAFSRAFRRECGRPPSAWRRQALA
jgi:AraC-like DNA-binding protein